MNIKPLKYGLAIAALAGFAGAAAAKTIVIRSTGPSSAAYPAGKVLADNGTITLKANDTVTILDGKGTRTLAGAGKHSLVAGTQTASTAQSSFQRLLVTQARPSRGGVSRGAGSVPMPPSLWYVDARYGGTFCVNSGGTLKVWRAVTESESRAKVSRPTGGQASSLDFRKGMSEKSWPVRDMPVTDGATYSLQMDDGQPVTIKFVVMPKREGSGAPALDDTAAALAEMGCSAQLNLLAETVSAAQASATPVS